MLLKMILSAAVLAGGVSVMSEDDTLNTSRIEAVRNREAAATAPLRIVSAAEAERRGALHLHEAVRHMSGVSLRDYGGIGGLKTVSVRGMGAAHTTVSYDGFVLSDIQNGQPDISRFCLDDIEEISVSIGHEDDIFKPARLMEKAGVLNVVRRKPVFEADSSGIKSSNVSARVTAASFCTYSPYIRYDRRFSDIWSVSAAASWLTSDGRYPFLLNNGSLTTKEIRKGSDVSVLGAGVDIYGGTPKGGQVTGKISFSSSERGLPGSVVLYTQNPAERLRERSLMTAVRYESDDLSALKYAVAATYSAAWTRYTDTDAVYSEPHEDNYLQQEAVLSIIVQYKPSERMALAVANDLSAGFLLSDIPENRSPQRLGNITSVSMAYRTGRFNATASVTGTFVKEKALRSNVPDRSHISPSAGVSYAFLRDNSLRLRASCKNSYRIPTFNDLYYARVGNQSLRPENALQFNAGMTFVRNFGGISGRCKGTAEITADLYCNHIKDKIAAIPTMFIWKMHNIGMARMYGAEIALKGRLSPTGWLDVFFSAGYGFQSCEDRTDPDSKTYGHQTAYVPRHSGNVSVSAASRWLTVTYMMTAVGERYSLGQNIPANLMSAYADHCVSVSRQFNIRSHSLRLSIEVMNLADVGYEVIRYYPMPGRNYRLTLKYLF